MGKSLFLDIPLKDRREIYEYLKKIQKDNNYPERQSAINILIQHFKELYNDY